MKKSLILLIFFISFSVSQNMSGDESQLVKSELIKALKKTLINVTKFKNKNNNEIRKLNRELAAIQREFRHYKQKQKEKAQKLQSLLSSVRKELLMSKQNKERSCQQLRIKLTYVEKKLFQKERELKKQKLQNVKKNSIEKESIQEESIQEEIFVMQDLNQVFIEPLEVDKPHQIMTNEKDLPSAINMAMEQAMNNRLKEEQEWVEVVVSE